LLAAFTLKMLSLVLFFFFRKGLTGSSFFCWSLFSCPTGCLFPPCSFLANGGFFFVGFSSVLLLKSLRSKASFLHFQNHLTVWELARSSWISPCRGPHVFFLAEGRPGNPPCFRVFGMDAFFFTVFFFFRRASFPSSWSMRFFFLFPRRAFCAWPPNFFSRPPSDVIGLPGFVAKLLSFCCFEFFF